METSDHGADIGQGSDTLFPSTAITFSICAVMVMKKKEKKCEIVRMKSVEEILIH